MNLAPTYVGLALGWLVVVYLVIFSDISCHDSDLQKTIFLSENIWISGGKFNKRWKRADCME